MKMGSLRVVPALVIAAIPLLGIKIYDLSAIVAGQAISTAAASTSPAAEKPADKPGADKARPDKPAADKPASDKPAADKPAADKSGAAKPEGDRSGASRPAGGGPPGRDASSFTPAEVDLLQALSQRRAEIDRRADELTGREVMLKAAEQRIDEKITALKEMEKNIDQMLQKKDEENEAKLKSIVKIYETMKPAEAARIFEQLDMPVLLDVVEHMKETKAAPILASMQPTKAKTVTLALAERHQAPKMPADSAKP